jgi:hypothetical protein
MLQAFASDVVIVSADGERRRLARLAGFRTRRGLRGLLHLLPPEQAERYRFRWYRVWRWIPLAQMAALLLPTLVVVGVVGLIAVLLPELRITMEPATDVDSALLDIRVDPTAGTPDVTARRLPGRWLSESYEVEGAVLATGGGRRPRDSARGTVTFVNSRENLLVVPRGYRLVSTNGITFVTEEEVRLPPNTLVGLRVNIQATTPGPQGNVAAMAITRPAEAAPAGLGVFNERPTEGGSEEEFPQVTERDFIALRGELLRRAQDAGWQRLLTTMGDEWGMVPDTLRVESGDETFSAGLRSEAAELAGRLGARATALTYRNSAFNDFAQEIWAASLPAGFRPIGGPPELTVPEYLGQEGGWALYRIGVRGRIARVMDGGLLATRLRGASVAEAQAALATRDGDGTPVQVEIWPSWAPRAFRLRLTQADTE